MTRLQTRAAWFQDVLRKYKRIAIVGGPTRGKTTLSTLALGRKVIHADDFIEKDAPDPKEAWSRQSARLRDAMNAETDFVAEGVAVARALRKGADVDCVVYLVEPCEGATAKHEQGAKATRTIVAEWYATHKHIPVLQAPPPDSSLSNV